MSSVIMSVKEVMNLASWIKLKDFSESHLVVTIESEDTGIGNCLEAKVKLSENESLCYDFTDYEAW